MLLIVITKTGFIDDITITAFKSDLTIYLFLPVLLFALLPLFSISLFLHL